MLRTLGLSVASTIVVIAGPGTLASAKAKPKAVIDLAETAQGSYSGDVISDARGSSHSHVHVTVTKAGPNTISVSADYRRIPSRTFKLTKVMSTIQNVGGTEVFLLDLSKSPHQLSLTIDDAAWSGTRDN